MKKLTLLLLCGVASMALSAEEYTIQTISALKESSITPAFEQKIKKTGIPYIKKTEGDRHVVLLGNYKKIAATKHDVKKVRNVVTHDAFVRPMNRGGAAVAATQEKPAVHTEVAAHAPESTPQVAVPVAVASAVLEKKVEPCPAQTPQVSTAPVKTVVIYDRNAMRKSDISEAIDYYKNSPYHTFRSIALQN